MWGRRTRWVDFGLILGTLALLWPGTGRADELAEFKALVAEQSGQIRELQDQVRKLENGAEVRFGGS